MDYHIFTKHCHVSVSSCNSRGGDAVVIKRLKAHLRREVILGDPTAPGDLLTSVQPNPYGLDYLCVLDFEATCEAENPPDYIHEIIEFPVLLLNLKTLQIVSTPVMMGFHGHK